MRGELGTFSVAEILQLIGMQEKSGVLRIRSKGRTAVLFFDSGKIVSARDRRQKIRDPFLLYLHENGELEIQDVNKVLETRKNEGGDLVELLLREKLVDEKKMSELLSRYALQIIANVIKWETGTYEFSVSSDGLPEKALIKPLRLEPILLEALRRKDEVEEIRRFLPGFETRLRMSEPTTKDLPLEDSEIEVAGLVDGRRTIEEIIEESKSDEVETLDTLEKLFALGIVSIAEDTVAAEEPSLLSPLKSIALTVALVIMAIVLRVTILAPGSAKDLPVNQARDTIDHLIEQREVQNLRFALESYKSVNQSYPGRLEDLIAVNMLQESQISDRYGRVYAYKYFAQEGRYVLIP